MIKEQVVMEKLKYLLLMTLKSTQFEVIDLQVEVSFQDETREKLSEYHIDVKFDYAGPLDFEIYSFAHDVQRMTEKLRDLLSEYVIAQDGKITSGKNVDYFPSDPLIYTIDYEVDTKHIFHIGFKFNYHD